jgi:hypothetical protein
VELHLRPTRHRNDNLTPSSRRKHHLHKPRYTGACPPLHVHRPRLKGVSSLSGDANPLHVCETDSFSSRAADMNRQPRSILITPLSVVLSALYCTVCDATLHIYISQRYVDCWLTRPLLYGHLRKACCKDVRANQGHQSPVR